MGVTRFKIRHRGISGGSDNRAVEYIALGDEDENVVLDYAELNAPAVWDGMPRTGFDIEELTVGVFSVKAKYERKDNNTPPGRETPVGGSVDFSFDIGLSSKLIKYSQSTVYSSANAPDHKGAINVQPDGSIEGVEKQTPESRFVLSYTVPNTVLDDAYKASVEDLVGTVNNATFKGRAAGEVMLIGAQGRQTLGGADATSTISFSFAVKKNRTSVTGNLITIAGITLPNATTIQGWDYLWVYYGKAEDTLAKDIVAKPIALYIERIYDRTNFAGLGLP